MVSSVMSSIVDSMVSSIVSSTVHMQSVAKNGVLILHGNLSQNVSKLKSNLNFSFV